MKLRRVAALLAGTALLAWGTASHPVEAAVGSTDYTVTTPANLWENPPATGTTSIGAPYNKGTTVQLPFAFTYFGEPLSTVDVSHYGTLLDVFSGFASHSINKDFSELAAEASDLSHGIIAPLWDDLYPQGVGTLKHWTAGTTPNRRWICAWIDYGNYYTPSSRYQFQVKFFEGSHRIEFAYKPETFPTTWTGASWSQGMNAVLADDPRYVCPVSTSITQSGRPPSDVRFDPRFVDVTGRVTFERVTPTASGIGSTTVAAPFSGGRIELRRAGVVLATTFADTDGNFAFHHPAGHPVQTGSIVALTDNAAVSVHEPANGVPFAMQIASGISLQSSSNLGTLVVTATADPAANWRGPANVARAAFDAWSWVTARTSEAVPKLPIHVDSGADASNYRAADGSAPASLRIGGAYAANPDLWDDPVIQREYARHVAASVVAPLTVTADKAFDKATTPVNAFAEAFGYWLWSAVTGGRDFVDATATDAAVTIDLEDPQPSSARGASVAAWVAAALHDLADAADEPHDWTDGTGAERDRTLTVVAASAGAPTAATFYEGWRSAGLPASSLSRNFVAHGLLTDDAYEPNDVAAEVRAIGSAPGRTVALALACDSEDWFDIDFGGSPLGITIEMAFDRAATPADIHLQVLDGTGKVLAERLDTGVGVVTVSTGPRAAGTVRVRIRHAGGAFVPDYELQAAGALEVPSASLPSWTEGRPYLRAFPVAGGVPPYSFELQPAIGAPPGVAFDATQLRAFGTPSTPGEYSFLVITRDSGVPAHQASTSQHIVIAAPLDLSLSEFLAFALGKPADVTYQHAGGTAPIEFLLTAGSPPPGLSMDADRLRFHGTPASAGSSTAHISGVDVAGSGDETDVTAVVCVAAADGAPSAALGEGEAACGFWFDAVAGTRAVLSAGTVKGQAKRAARAAALGPGGADVEGAALKPGNGRASATFEAPVSGRYFVVIASAAGAATQISAKLALAAPKKGAGALSEFGPGDIRVVTFGALAGATLSFKATPDKAAGVTANVLALIRPDGTAVPLDGLVSQKGVNVSLAAPLDQSGTWTVRVRGQGGEDGALKFSYKLKQPKGVAYSAE